MLLDAIYTAGRKQYVRMFESGGIHIFNNEFRALFAGVNGGIDLGSDFDKSKTILVSLKTDS
jgi:hypothetical protein